VFSGIEDLLLLLNKCRVLARVARVLLEHEIVKPFEVALNLQVLLRLNSVLKTLFGKLILLLFFNILSNLWFLDD